VAARPYVIVNVAASVDGKIDTFERRGAAISSASDRARVDGLRASVDAVMVGGHTLVAEDPRLTVKSAALRAARVERGAAENPTKVGVVSSLERLKPDGRFVSCGPARVIVFTPVIASDTAAATRHQGATDSGAVLRMRGVEIFARGESRVDLSAAMATLHHEGIRRVLVEGGGTLNFELFRLGLVDELHVYMAPLIFGGSSAPTMADGVGLPRHEAIKLVHTGADIDDDGGVVLRYKVEPRE
jgi:2,5-diamino-6-(ribosylamino)-4(3H)-pyrimidinone 5'-phosphate reductase